MFSCEVSRAGGPQACWWLDGTLLQDSPQSTIAVCDGTIHSLTLSGLGVADSGTITFRTGPLVSTAKLLVKGISQWRPLSWCFCLRCPHASCRLLGSGRDHVCCLHRASPVSLLAQGEVHLDASLVPLLCRLAHCCLCGHHLAGCSSPARRPGLSGTAWAPEG